MYTYLVELHRVNPETRCCDDSGRKSSFYDSCNGYRYLAEKAKQSLRKACGHKYSNDFFDFDKDVYMIKIINLVTKKERIIV